ncbi:hypothetical protein GCM10020000_10920 [Streptomyces olivoverticillatus]
MSATHEVFNQAPPLTGFSTADDPALLEALHRDGGGWGEAEVRALGERAGSQEVQDWARMAEATPPVLRTHDRYGHRIDEVDFHPAWHHLMAAAVESGQHAAPWAEARPGGHLVRAAKFYVWAQAEPGHGCPISMTYAAVPALRAQPELAAHYEPLLASRTYDYGLRPPLGKRGLIAGMSMTEKQGGSDVRANTTTAVPAGDGTYVLTGHKWFTSAPHERRLPGAGPDGCRAHLLPDAARTAGRHPQRHAAAAAEGQARQPLQRLGRDRVRAGRGLAGGRAGARGAHHRRDGQHDPSRLRRRLGRRHAGRAAPGPAPRPAPAGVRRRTG